MRRWRVWAVEAAILLVAVALTWALPRHLAFTAIAENLAQDFRAGYFAEPEPTHPDIVVVAITEDTLAKFPYRFPVDRAFLADLLNTLNGIGVKAVAFDILFDQATEPEKDAAFREALLNAKMPVIVGWTDRETGLTDAQAEFQQEYLQGIRAAYSNTLKDVSDSTIRRVFPGRNDEDGQFRPAFPAAIAAVLGAKPPQTEVTLRYRTTEDPAKPAFRVFPAHAVKVLPKAWLANKIVLVGADLPFEDRHRTPLAATLGRIAGTLPGVVIHAHAVAQLLEGKEAAHPDTRAELAAAILLALIAIGLSFARIGLWLRLPLALGALVLFAAVNFAAFRYANIALPLVSPIFVFALTVGASSYHSAQIRDGETRFIREAFSRYVTPNLVRKLQDQPELLALGGEERELTVLFTDVEGFTSLSETLEPPVLVRVLNEYLDGMVACVHKHEGMVDKFIGDAVMAVFGAPEKTSDHAAKAIACAIDMHLFATAFAKRQREEGIDWGRTRLGVHTGRAVVGNVGGSNRVDYTAIGDTVNTGSRLEGVNKYLGTSICISETAAKAAPGVKLRPIGRLVVKGRTEPLGTYTPILPGEEALAEEYLIVFTQMAAGEAASKAALGQLAERHAGDGLIAFHIKRLKEEPPSDLIVMKDK